MTAGHLGDLLTAFVIGHFGHAAGVDQTDVGRLTLMHRFGALLLQAFDDGRGLGVVELASERKTRYFASFELFHGTKLQKIDLLCTEI